ncbi:MAG: hypothetical protein IKW45_05330 [Clostridia bacterium]|nr:hypothetical protein [Clostridia bacterium]
MARKPVRGGREKEEWEKRFYSKVHTEMDIYNLKNIEVGKAVGVCEDTFSYKLNEPRKLTLDEFCNLCDFLHLDRAELVSMVPKKGARK